MAKAGTRDVDGVVDHVGRALLALGSFWHGYSVRAVVETAKFMTPRQYLYNLQVGIQWM